MDEKIKQDFWDELPDEVKADIEEAIRQADAGEVMSREEAMKKFQKRRDASPN